MDAPQGMTLPAGRSWQVSPRPGQSRSFVALDLAPRRVPRSVFARYHLYRWVLAVVAAIRFPLALHRRFAIVLSVSNLIFPFRTMPLGPTQHVPVLAQEVLEWLRPAPGQTMVDGTLGGGGHTRLLAQAVGPGGVVIALDRDPAAVERATLELRELPVRVVQGNYSDLPEVLAGLNVDEVDGILLDLGLSSDQLADAERGFSFQSNGPLDLRFDPSRGEPAWKFVERLSAEHLADLIYRYGEERYSRRIARHIVEVRRATPIHTATQLARVIRESVPRSREDRIDPATRTFQALRIAVNEELKWLEVALRRLPDCLKPGGRLAVISFHSLEDRLVKESFREDARWVVHTRRPVRATEQEVAANARSRSAKLRVAERRPS